METQDIRAWAFDLYYLLSLPQERHGEFFPPSVPYRDEIGEEPDLILGFLWARVLEADAKNLVTELRECFALARIFSLVPQECDFWSPTPTQWAWLWDEVQSIAQSACARHGLQARDIKGRYWGNGEFR